MSKKNTKNYLGTEIDAFIEEVKAKLKEKKLSVNKLSKITGIDQAKLSRALKKQSILYFTYVFRIAKVLDISLDGLLMNDKTKAPEISPDAYVKMFEDDFNVKIDKKKK